MQHRHFARRHLAFALMLALVAGVRAVAAETLSIEWDPNPEAEVVGYRVFIGSQPGVYDSHVDVGNVTTYNVGVVQAGRTYCFAVAAFFSGPEVGAKSPDVCTDANRPPVLPSPGNQSNAVGVALTLTLAGSDPEGLPVTYSALGLPAGLTLNQNTGFISGTPTAVGTANVTVTASDGVLSTSQAFTWSITAAVPGVATPLRPTGNIATATPTFEWESVATASVYRLWVDDASTTDPKIQLDLTPTQAGCTTAGAVCHVSPGIALAAGRASWSVRASNGSGAGPWSGAMDFAVADTRIPTVSITAPTSASTYTTSAATIVLAGTAMDDGGVTQVTWTNNQGGSGTASGTTAWSVASIPLVGGANIITVTARDAGGNIGTDILSVTRNDGGAPTLTILSPTSPYSTTSTTLAMSGSASDDVAVTQVTWVTDRGFSGTAAGTTAWTIAAIALKPGANGITVTAQDASGNKTTKTLAATLTDSDTPTITITGPTAATAYSTGSETLALNGTTSDAFGVVQVTWSSDRGGAGAGGLAAGATWTIASVPILQGVNVITVTGKDAAGHAGTDVITVTRGDGVLPTIAIAAPVAGTTFSTTSTSIALGGTASDNVGVVQVTWSNSKGGNGVAVGTTSWAVAGVALHPGANVITVTAKDPGGNAGTDVLTVTMTDAVAPAVAITSPTTGDTHTTTAATVALAGTASDLFGVTEVRWASDRGGSGVAAGTTAWSVPALPLLTGVNVITVTASDAAGNIATDRISITTDGKAPTISIATPAANSVTKADTASLSGTANDDLGVTEVTWTSNRGGNGRAAGTTSWSVAAAALQSGVNVITVVAQDAAGNRTSATVSVTRDSEAPTVAVVAPTAGGSFVTNKASLALSGKAADTTGVTQVTWQNNRGGSGTMAGTTDWAVPAVALLAGPNVITVTARDAAGNSGTATLTVTLDTRAPVISIAAPTSAGSFATTANGIALGGIATDDVALAEVTWSNNQGGSGAATGTSAWSVARVALKVGLNTLTVTARDSAGNTAVATLAIRVTDVRAPAVRITGPSPDAAFSTAVGVINLEGMSEDDFGVARITWASDRGASGVAKGDSRWIVGGIALQPGVNVITVTAADASGNTSTDVARITYERGVPTISLTSPTTADTYTTSSSAVALTGVASDDTGVARVKWFTDKGQVGDAVGTTAWAIPSVTVTTGTTVVTVTAYDNSGNSASLTLNIVYADTSKPGVKIYTPTTASSFTTSTSSVTVAGTAIDNIGVTQVTWATDKGASGTAFGTSGWSTPSLPLAPGTTVVTISARDAAGNTGVAVLTVTSNATSSLEPSIALRTTSSTTTTAGSSPLTSASMSVESAGSTTPYAETVPATSPSSSTQQTVAPPVVRILVPTAAARFSTMAASLSLAGVASHASGISVVRWMTDKGDAGVADGTAKWTVAAIPIKPGTTTITVTAFAAAGGGIANTVLMVSRPDPLPKLSLTYPTADSQWTSGTDTVALKGTATENVTRVLWSSESGATGVAAGTTAWAIAGIRLQEGVNRITLTAQDASGRTDRHVLTITYHRPGLTAAVVRSAGLE